MTTLTQSQLDAAAGKVLTLPAGSYAIPATVSVHSGTTIIGDANGGTKIAIALSAPGYGFKIDGNASHVTFENLDITSNYGLIAMKDGSLYTSIHVINCRLSHGGGLLPDGTLVFGISCTIANTDTQVLNNYFHDSMASVRSWCIFESSNSNFDHNTFENVVDGGQLEYMGSNVSFSYNYGHGLHRMGQETAGAASTVNFKVVGNVFYGYQAAYNDTEGVSICIYGTNTQIEDNYFAANFEPGATYGAQSGAAAGGPNRFGYAIEASGTPCTVSGNTIIGSWAEFVSVMSPGIVVSNNKFFGSAVWANVAGEPGPTGALGSAIQSNNTWDANVAHAPPPPANTNTYLGSTPTSIPTTGPVVSAPAIVGITATSPSSGTVDLKWTTPLPSAGTISIISTVGRQAFASVAVAAGATSANLQNVHPGWQIDFQIAAGSLSSGVVTVNVAGKSTAAYTGNPSLVPTLVKTVIVTTQTFSDGSTKVATATTP